MKYTQLGDTDITVSRVCLGSMTWGKQNTEAEGQQQLDFAVNQGINFIDTAEMYPVPPDADSYGRTETIIGNWLNKRSDRDQLIIASKVCAWSERASPGGSIGTSLRSSASCLCAWAAYSTEPRSVCITNCVATRREKPICTPASIIASINMNT